MTVHTYIEKRDVGVCDFCSRPAVRWRYACTTTIVMESPVGGAVSNDAWAACDPCARLIEKRQPRPLAEHVLTAGAPEDPQVAAALADPLFRAIALGGLMDLYTRLLPVLGERTPDDGDTSKDPEAGLKVRYVQEADDTDSTTPARQ